MDDAVQKNMQKVVEDVLGSLGKLAPGLRTALSKPEACKDYTLEQFKKLQSLLDAELESAEFRSHWMHVLVRTGLDDLQPHVHRARTLVLQGDFEMRENGFLGEWTLNNLSAECDDEEKVKRLHEENLLPQISKLLSKHRAYLTNELHRIDHGVPLPDRPNKRKDTQADDRNPKRKKLQHNATPNGVAPSAPPQGVVGGEEGEGKAEQSHEGDAHAENGKNNEHKDEEMADEGEGEQGEEAQVPRPQPQQQAQPQQPQAAPSPPPQHADDGSGSDSDSDSDSSEERYTGQVASIVTAPPP